MSVNWQCSECETVNQSRARVCMVCQHERPKKPSPVGEHSPIIGVVSSAPKAKPARVASRSASPAFAAASKPRPSPPKVGPSPSPKSSVTARAKDRKVRRWTGGALVTLVVPWAVGHWVWRPLWAPPMLSPHPEVLADQYWWIPEYVFGVSAVLVLMLVAFLRQPRRSRSFVHWTALVCAALAPIWLAAPAQHLVERYGRYKYEHYGISVSVLHGTCVQTVRRWSRRQNDETFTWTVARSGDCAKVVVYRGWAQVWTRSARSKHVIGGTLGHYEGLVMAVEATKREGRTDRVMALDDTTGKKMWSYNCPKGPMGSPAFVGADDGQAGTPVKGRTRYVRVRCDGRTVLLDAAAKKHILKVIE